MSLMRALGNIQWPVASGVFLNLVLVTATSAQSTGDELQRARQAEQRRIQVIHQASRASISVFPATGGSGGSGVVISADGLALTNYHVVKPCGNYMHCSMPDGEIYDAVLVGLDPTGDVALIKLLGRDDFPSATIGDSDRLRVGDFCFAVGNPFLLATDFQPTVSWGIVSGVHRYQYPAGTLLEYADCIQTDAAINPGNSGGPLFNGQGELVGINGRGSFEKRGRVNVGVGYAISINQIKLFMDHLSSGRIVDHATLGATVTSTNDGRVVVDNILSNSDAYRRGLRYDDQIIAFGGRQIETVNEFKNVLGIYPKGWRVPLKFRREGREYSVIVRLAGVHSAEELVDMVQGKPPRGGPKLPGPKQEPESEPGRVPKGGPKQRGPGRPQLVKKESPTVEIPDHVGKFIETRRGYANYYFNRLRRDEVWRRFASTQRSPNRPVKWKITGRLDDGTAVQILLSQNGSGLQWASQAVVLEPDLDLGSQLEPDGSGGLLPALHLWHRLVNLGPTSYGDVYYLGGLPASLVVADDPDPVLDQVLVATFDVMKTHFFFDRKSGLLNSLEMWSEPDLDPCELEFAQYETIGEVFFPRTITAKFGEQFRWSLKIDEIEISDDQISN